MTKNLNKKIAMVIAFSDFKDEEYFIPREIFERAGVEVATVSNKSGMARGVSGAEVAVALKLDNLEVADYDGVVFVGGSGCLENLDNESSYSIAREAVERSKVLAAICISPIILAKAGVLEGKKATVWFDPLYKEPIKILKENGAIYQDESVTADGKIVTANGPQSAEDFAEAVLEVLTRD
ncbi:DJ-1/PfpI family protein [Patescibacteria group bacterium]|nr:DJ-1/PfpI family protein [Patescibacteria group bacterium]